MFTDYKRFTVVDKLYMKVYNTIAKGKGDSSNCKAISNKYLINQLKKKGGELNKDAGLIYIIISSKELMF